MTDAATPAGTPMSPREIRFAMAGITLSLFVAQLSNLVILTALPGIVAELHGGQAAYTWIVTTSMLTITVTTPIWGRFSDTLDKKRLLQLCVAGYVGASCIAGAAGVTWLIIACRAAIGICAAGIIVLMQAISAEITTPRLRARWTGYRSAAASVATVGAPTVGGLVAAHLGWRWCFYVAVPLALAAIAMVQFTLHLPEGDRAGPRRLDWPGTLLFSGGFVLLMLWVSIAGPERGWGSQIALGTLAAGLIALAAGIAVELRHPAPMLPLALFADPAILLCVVAAAATGFAFFGSAVFLSVYLQIGRGFSPSVAGLMAVPEAIASLVSALAVSWLIARTGHYKRPMIVGGAMICCGFGLLGRVDTETSLIYVGLSVALIGGGLGAVAENIVLIVQTLVPREQIGAGGALIAFFRVTGGVICVATLGAILDATVRARLAGSDIVSAAGALPHLADMIPARRLIFNLAYSGGVARLYQACTAISLVLLACLCILTEKQLADDS